MNFAQIEEILQRYGSVCLVTIIETSGHTPNPVGAKMLVGESAELLAGTIGGGNLEEQARNVAQERIKLNQHQVMSFPLNDRLGQCCGGKVELFFEILNSGPKIDLYGSGHVSLALAPLLIQAGFQVRVIDPRAEWLEKMGAFKKVESVQLDYQNFLSQNTLVIPSFSLIFTHSHHEDRIILKYLLKNRTGKNYIGLIGSTHKAQVFAKEMQQEFDSLNITDYYQCPIGEPNGGKKPIEVAISIMQEILLQYHQKEIDGEEKADLS
ncbi:XdhC family protein [Bacteriovoracaceae bacterium]|nr:XdhC family protein [Bacteriovoracaceae bacterium]